MGYSPTTFLPKFWYVPWIKFIAGFLVIQYAYGTYRNWREDMERVKDPNKWTEGERKAFAEYVLKKK